MGHLFSGTVQTFFPDTRDPYLVFIVRCKIVTETISIPLNLLLLIQFHYLYRKHKAKRAEYAHSTKRLKAKEHISDETIVQYTYLLLIFGFIFSICQGLLENFALNNCASIVNTYFEFFFYIGHRTLLLLIFLNRLFVVFAGSAYSYPHYLYYILFCLIIVCGILSFISHSFNLSIMKVPSGWNLWNDGDNVCSWQFGPMVTHFTRPFDYALNATILSLFLYKLSKLQNVIKRERNKEIRQIRVDSGTDKRASITSKDISITNESASSVSRTRRREHSNLEIIARRMSILTFIAIISSVIVTGGYLGYSIRIIGALWPFDLILNSFCCVLMFRWTNFMIKPCFGNKCDRCCCIKFLSCCDCVCVGCCDKKEDLEINRGDTFRSEEETDINGGDTLRSDGTLRSQGTDRIEPSNDNDNDGNNV